jgi:hypothetical protein
MWLPCRTAITPDDHEYNIIVQQALAVLGHGEQTQTLHCVSMVDFEHFFTYLCEISVSSLLALPGRGCESISRTASSIHAQARIFPSATSAAVISVHITLNDLCRGAFDTIGCCDCNNTIIAYHDLILDIMI